MFFVAESGYTASLLRGVHVAGALGARCIDQIDETSWDTAVFVKRGTFTEVAKAKSQGNRIVYDVIDYFCYPDRECVFSSLVDVVLIPNMQCVTFYRSIFKDARLILIPHQWDYRLTKQAQRDFPAVGYIGQPFNRGQEGFEAECVFNEREMLEKASDFNIHVCITKRDHNGNLLKPATKVSTAAAVGAVAVTYPDPSAVELLGDYPFYIEDTIQKCIDKAKASFGGPAWRQARRIMEKVKHRTSLATTIERYRELEVEYA